MRIRSLVLLSLSGSLAACGGGSSTTPDAPEKDIGFNKPTKPLAANHEDMPKKWTEVGPADLSCLGTPNDDVATTAAITVNTTVRDFQSDGLVPNANVTVFKDQNVGTPIDTKMADGNAMVSVVIPIGTKRFGYKMTDPSSLDTLLLNQTVDPAMTPVTVGKIQAVSKTTAQTLPALIGVTRTAGTGVLAGAMRDCQNREMSNFIATVSTTSGQVAHVEGADTYYFSSSVGLPVRHGQKEASSEDGLFMVIELGAAPTAFVQIWGYPTQADLDADTLKLVAELQTQVIADTVITGSYEPLRTP
jgi:hypothetical protein